MSNNRSSKRVSPLKYRVIPSAFTTFGTKQGNDSCTILRLAVETDRDAVFHLFGIGGIGKGFRIPVRVNNAGSHIVDSDSILSQLQGQRLHHIGLRRLGRRVDQHIRVGLCFLHRADGDDPAPTLFLHIRNSGLNQKKRGNKITVELLVGGFRGNLLPEGAILQGGIRCRPFGRGMLNNKEFSMKQKESNKQRILVIAIAAALILSILLIVFLLKGCTKNTELVGVWRYDQYTEYEFKDSNAGCMCLDGSTHYEFIYRVEEGTLYIDFALDYITDCQYTYSVENNMLILVGGDGTAQVGKVYRLTKIE